MRFLQWKYSSNTTNPVLFLKYMFSSRGIWIIHLNNEWCHSKLCAIPNNLKALNAIFRSHFFPQFSTVWGVTGALLITSSRCTLFLSNALLLPTVYLDEPNSYSHGSSFFCRLTVHSVKTHATFGWRPGLEKYHRGLTCVASYEYMNIWLNRMHPLTSNTTFLSKKQHSASFSELPDYPTLAPGHVTNAAPDINHMTTGLADGKKEGASETQRNLVRERLALVMSHRCSLPTP